MSKLQLDTRTDETGSLQVRLPHPGEYRVRVTVEWDEASECNGAWPAGWLEATAGSISDPTFVRPEQPSQEEREELG